MYQAEDHAWYTPSGRKDTGMSRRAWIYIWTIYLIGATLCGVALTLPLPPAGQWGTFAVLTVCATCAQLFKAIFRSRLQSDTATISYSATMVFLFAGVLLLHPLLFALLVTVPHLIEWIRERWIGSANLRAWYIQPFNIALHMIAGVTAHAVYTAAYVDTAYPFTPAPVFAAGAAALAYLFLNHLLIGIVLVLARGASWRDTGMLDPETSVPEFINLCLGYVVAVVWQLNPWLILPALSPLVLMYRSLMVPQLKKEAQTDGKTGLYNARHFSTLFDAEMERAKRFNRPLAVIMADLDLLRHINNTYGHLAGDTVLAGIGQIIRTTVRDYDIAGRFGGEEFSVVLPEVELPEAQAFAERLRVAIAMARFDIPTSSTPIGVTMSLGVACFPQDGNTLTELTHAADVAVYQAKQQGRNRVVCAAHVPPAVQQEYMLSNDGSASGAAPASPKAQPTATASLPAARTVTPVCSVPAAAPSSSQPPTSVPIGEKPIPAPKRYGVGLLRLFVSSVIATALGVTLLGLAQTRQFDVVTLGLLIVLAALTECLHVDVYGGNTISVSAAVSFAAALMLGLPGIVSVSATIALIHYVRQRPALYKTGFNWATHVLAGTAPLFMRSMFVVGMEPSISPMLLLATLVAATAYYLIESGLVTTAISIANGRHWVATWREQFQWLAGAYLVFSVIGLFLALAYAAFGVVGVIVFVLPLMMMRHTQQQYVRHTETSVHEVRRINEALTHANQEIVHANRFIHQLNGELQQFNDELLLTLASIIDARDPFVFNHAAQVAAYATAVAGELGLPAQQVEHIRQAALLHDIGKLGIPEHVLHKPCKLTDEEYALIQTHAALGADLLQANQHLRHLASFVRHHHERWDGQGYPDRLLGEQIPLEARILAVCDAVDVMASDRPYHRARPLPAIIDEVKRCAGAQFDPRVAEAFVRLAEREGAHLIINSAKHARRMQVDVPTPQQDTGGRYARLIPLPQPRPNGAVDGSTSHVGVA